MMSPDDANPMPTRNVAQGHTRPNAAPTQDQRSVRDTVHRPVLVPAASV